MSCGSGHLLALHCTPNVPYSNTRHSEAHLCSSDIALQAQEVCCSTTGQPATMLDVPVVGRQLSLVHVAVMHQGRLLLHSSIGYTQGKTTHIELHPVECGLILASATLSDTLSIFSLSREFSLSTSAHACHNRYGPAVTSGTWGTSNWPGVAVSRVAMQG